MNRATILLCIAVVASVAHADRGVVVTVGAGVTYDRYDSYHLATSLAEERWGPAGFIDAKYRFFDELALGIHFAVSRGERSFRCTDDGTATHVFAVIPALLGVTVEYTILDRVWLAPWIGVLDLETRFDHNTGQCDAFYGYIDQQVEQRLAYGLGFGADMFILGRHRVGPFVQLARARHAYQPLQGSFTAGYYPDNFDDDLLVTFGVAYRYW